MKILFQGDSITDGNRYKEPERRHDLNHQIGHSYAFIVSGMLGAEYPDAGLQFVNRGISADTTRRLLRRWRADALDIEPDILSMLIGVNDCFLFEDENHIEPEEYESNLENMLSQSFETNAELKVFLMEPFFLPTRDRYKSEEDVCRRKLGRYSQVCRRIAEKDDRIFFIPLQKVFDSAAEGRDCAYWIWDGIHPTESGHALIAREWIKAFKAMFE